MGEIMKISYLVAFFCLIAINSYAQTEEKRDDMDSKEHQISNNRGQTTFFDYGKGDAGKKVS